MPVLVETVLSCNVLYFNIAKKLERGHAMDSQRRDEFSHFRNRTVTSPDALSAHKKVHCFISNLEG